MNVKRLCMFFFGLVLFAYYSNVMRTVKNHPNYSENLHTDGNVIEETVQGSAEFGVSFSNGKKTIFTALHVKGTKLLAQSLLILLHSSVFGGKLVSSTHLHVTRVFQPF